MRREVACLCLVLAASAASALEAIKPPKPLFADSSPLAVTVSAPFRTIAREMESTPKPYAATLESGAERLSVELLPRGNFRRSKANCSFPPLRIVFGGKPGDESVFAKQDELKLVTHCQDRDKFDKYVLLEYLAYRLYNQITPASHQVRLVDVTYLDSATGKEFAHRRGFLIEEISDVAKRVGMKQVKVEKIQPAQLSVPEMSLVAVFHYMVGNLDWSAIAGNPGERCCHNGKLIGPDSQSAQQLVAVPYDFDHGGLVSPPYAKPPASLKVPNVRTRVYRGFCSMNEALPAAIRVYRDRKAALYQQIAEVPGLEESARKTATRYIDSFFETIEDERAVQDRLVAKCRG